MNIPNCGDLRPCYCREGKSCIGCRFVARARLRLIKVETRPISQIQQPVQFADMRTSAADCRVAFCVALGVPLENIDPASGHDRGMPA